ncbi:NnrS family protein [Ramlibacter sp.]|uniref:NnrS family protein n=1 Tax=Ramlibacter sp. TaxID=1917967 RepID=UPI002BF7B10E|nr:NnrS family protein [Ramlibacter sp.]HWI80870.1 NnrS family protein [Ramlibacter sp.]
MRAAAGDGAWHWRRLLDGPHRLGFFLAMVVLAASGLWWAGVQLQRGGWLPLAPMAVAPSLVHAGVMTFGFFPLFFAGFLFTAGPRWLQVRGPSAAKLWPPLAAQCAGWLLWLGASHGHARLAQIALLFPLLGFGWTTAALWRLIRASRESDRLHPKIVGAAFAVGALSLAGLALALAFGGPAAARLAVLTGLWGCVVPVFVTVANRMIPFFAPPPADGLGRWPHGTLLWLLLAVCVFEVAAAWVDPLLGSQPLWHLARGAVELGTGAVLLWLAALWARVQNIRIRLLSMLYLGFAWFGVALALAGGAQLAQSVTGVAALPLAPLHALTMGALGSLMLAMVTRVTAGHGGFPVVADNFVWTLFWGLQAATLLRIAATLPGWPMQPLLTAAALLWAGLMLAWGLRYGARYGRAAPPPRHR